MSEASHEETFITGRGGFKVPTYEFSDTMPAENLKKFLGFFRDIWKLNVGRETWDVNYARYSQLGLPAITEHLLIPAVADKPLASARYQYLPPFRQHGAPTELHTVLSAKSGNIRDLEPIVKVFYLPSSNAEFAGARDALTVETTETTRHYQIYEQDDFFNSYTADDIADHQLLPETIEQITNLLA